VGNAVSPEYWAAVRAANPSLIPLKATRSLLDMMQNLGKKGQGATTHAKEMAVERTKYPELNLRSTIASAAHHRLFECGLEVIVAGTQYEGPPLLIVNGMPALTLENNDAPNPVCKQRCVCEHCAPANPLCHLNAHGMTLTNTGGACSLNAALRSSLCGPFFTSVCDVHTHLRVYKHPWPQVQGCHFPRFALCDYRDGGEAYLRHMEEGSKGTASKIPAKAGGHERATEEREKT
jgi:hypothetical protein